jgi:hypothetical protein
MKEGLLQDKDGIEKIVSENERGTNILPMKIAIEVHIARVNDDLSSLKWALDIQTNCVVNARKWISQPQAAPPSLLTDSFGQSSPSFPKGKISPLP